MTPEEIDELIQNGGPREQALLLYSELGAKPLGFGGKRLTTQEQYDTLSEMRWDDTTGTFDEVAHCFYAFMNSYNTPLRNRVTLTLACEELHRLLDLELMWRQYAGVLNNVLGCIEDKRTQGKALRAIEASFKGAKGRAYKSADLPIPEVEAGAVQTRPIPLGALHSQLERINHQTIAFGRSSTILKRFLRNKRVPFRTPKMFMAAMDKKAKEDLKALSKRLELAYPEGIQCQEDLMKLSDVTVKHNPKHTVAIYSKGRK